MEIVPNQLWEVLYFLGTAVIVSLICNKLKITSILGYLIAGLIVGPSFFSLFPNIEVPKHIAEFGILFLLFTIGLELPWERLQELRKYVLSIGVLQVTLTSVLFGGLASYFGASFETSVLIGMGLSLSSTAVVLQLLFDQKEISSRYGRVSFSILLLQDLVVIGLLVWITLLPHSSTTLVDALLLTLLKVLAVAVGFIIFGRYLLKPFYRIVADARSPELFFAVTLLIIIATSYATKAAGLSLALGAFLAGLLLAETEYRHQVEADIRPFRSLLLGLFFLTIGMSLDINTLITAPLQIACILFLLITGKTAVTLMCSIIIGLPFKSAIRLALLLSGGSEFVFILFQQAQMAGLISGPTNQLVYLTTVLSMILTPFLAYIGNLINKRFGYDMGIDMKAAAEESIDLKNHVILVGYGLIGETVHNLLTHQLIPHIIVDMDIARVTTGRAKKIPIFYGDAKKIEVFQAFQSERAKAIILSLDDFTTSCRIIIILKNYYPHLKIFARVQDSDQALQLKEMGAHPIVPEMFAPSFQLASAIFELFEMPNDKIDTIIEKYRRSLLQKQNFKNGKVPWISKVFK